MTAIKVTDINEELSKAKIQNNIPRLFELTDHLLKFQPDDHNVLYHLFLASVSVDNYGVARCVGETIKQTFWHHIEFRCMWAVTMHNCFKHEEAIRIIVEDIGIDNIPDDNIELLSAILGDSGSPDDCLKLLARVREKLGNSYVYDWRESLCLLEKGEFERGFDLYGARIQVRSASYPLLNDKYAARYNGEEGKTVFVIGEQGIGDEIMFSSCLPDLIATSKKVYFKAHNEALPSLMAESFPMIHVVNEKVDFSNIVRPHLGTEFANESQDDETRKFFEDNGIDAWCFVGDLPKFFRKKQEDFPKTPYLLTGRTSSKTAFPKIGIAWIGGQRNTRGNSRAIAPDEIISIFPSNCEILSLNYQVGGDQTLLAAVDEYPENFTSDPLIATKEVPYLYTAEKLLAMDFIITCCTSIVHLAGAMGVKAYCLVPNTPAWRYGHEGDQMPFYESVRLIRQLPNEKDWSGAIVRAKALIEQENEGIKWHA